MRRLQTALLAAFTGVVSAPAARGSDIPQAHAWAQNTGGLPEGPIAAPEPEAASVPAPSEEAQWSARVTRRTAELSASVAGGGPHARATPHDEALAAELTRLTEYVSRYADVGVAVRELDTGDAVFSFHADRDLNPASNHKLLTAIAAVELLGSDYRFTTEVRVDGDTLYLVGDGDPSLQVDDLRGLAARTAAAKVDWSRISRIVADDSAFSSQRFGPGYCDDGPGWSYLAPSGALSLQFNTIEVQVRAGRTGEHARVTVDPPSPHIVVENHAVSGGRGRLHVQTREEGATTVVSVRGRVARGGPVLERRRIADPTQYTASTFAMVLSQYTGTLLTVERGVAPTDAQIIAEHDSAPLTDVLTAALVFSNNFTSEQVLRTLGRRATGQPGDWDNGHLALERFWEAIGRDASELTFENASGYSTEGRLTADGIVDLLALTHREGSPAATLVDVLPASGKHGTMRNRLRRARGRVRAKTGTLAGASALSGLVQSRDGSRQLGFSILVNGSLPAVSSRRLQDRMVMALVDHLD